MATEEHAPPVSPAEKRIWHAGATARVTPYASCQDTRTNMTGSLADSERSPAEFGVLMLDCWRRPQNQQEAQALLTNAAILRTIGRTESRPSFERMADDQAAAASEVICYTPARTPLVGAGGELIPAADEPSDMRDTVRNPDRTSAFASAERLKLAADTHSLELAVDLAETIGAKDSIEKQLAHQMAVTHRLMMRIAERVTRELDNLPPGKLPQNATIEIGRLINAQCRLADTYQGGIVTLAKKRNPNKQTIVVRQVIQADKGAQVAIAGAVTSGGGVKSDGG